MNGLMRLSTAAKLNVTGLALTAAGMLLQIAAGSKLYPTFAGPIVLLAAAVTVALKPGRWTSYLGLAVPLLLGVGAVIAAIVRGDYIEQLTGGYAGILLGSLIQFVGLVAAVGGALRMLLDRRGVAALEH